MVDNIKQIGGRVGMGVSALGTLLMVGVMLAGPSSAAGDPVAGAFDDMETKVTTYGAAIVALVVLSVGIFLGIKYLRKGISKA